MNSTLNRALYGWTSPPTFYRGAGVVLPWTWLCALVFLAVGLYYAWFNSPPDYQQGELVRVFYVHVPAAFISMLGYGMAAVAGLIGLVWRVKLFELFVREAAPLGASLTALTLITGMLWGKPTWGTYWIWDARLTSYLFMLFLWLGLWVLSTSFEDERQGARAACVLAMVGAVNLPIVHYSVTWWSSLHQGSTIAEGKIHMSMLVPFGWMFVGMLMFCAAVMLVRLRAAVLVQNGSAKWLT